MQQAIIWTNDGLVHWRMRHSASMSWKSIEQIEQILKSLWDIFDFISLEKYLDIFHCLIAVAYVKQILA